MDEETKDKKQRQRREIQLAQQQSMREAKRAQWQGHSTEAVSTPAPAPNVPEAAIPEYAIKISLRVSVEHVPLPAYTRNKVMINAAPPAPKDESEAKDANKAIPPLVTDYTPDTPR
jgi:hypothetical protein